MGIAGTEVYINVMAEIDVPGHAESSGAGYPNLWPSPSCREPLDVSKNSTFDVVSGILTDMRKIFPFGLFHLGGDEVNTGKRPSTHSQISSILELWYITGWVLVFVRRLLQKGLNAFTATRVLGIWNRRMQCFRFHYYFFSYFFTLMFDLYYTVQC